MNSNQDKAKTRTDSKHVVSNTKITATRKPQAFQESIFSFFVGKWTLLEQYERAMILLMLVIVTSVIFAGILNYCKLNFILQGSVLILTYLPTAI